MMDDITLQAVVSNLKLRNPIGTYPFYMLIETSGSDAKHDEEKLSKFLDTAMSEGAVLDGTVTNEPSRMQVYACLKKINIILSILNLPKNTFSVLLYLF